MASATSKPAPAHSRILPSAASRWTVCTASVAFIEANKGKLPPDSSPFADEGTKCHELVADVLVGKHRLLQTDDADMLTNGRGYVEFVRSQIQPDDKVDIERRVSLFYLPSQYGTIDVRLVSSKRIAIIDLKYGAGVGVYAEQNKQLAIYAESAIQELELMERFPDDFPVSLYVYQPRDRNDSEPVRLWHLTRGELRDFVAPIQAAANLVQQGDPAELKFVPNPDVQCRFCNAKGICKDYGSHGLSVVTPEEIDTALAAPTLVIPDPNLLTRTQRVRILDASDGLRSFLDAVEAQEVHELMSGAERAGYKLVEGKSNRKWKDESVALATLIHLDSSAIDEVAPRIPITPAVAMKRYKDAPAALKELNAIIVKPPGKPTLALESDKRPVLQLTAAEGLENIDVI